MRVWVPQRAACSNLIFPQPILGQDFLWVGGSQSHKTPPPPHCHKQCLHCPPTPFGSVAAGTVDPPSSGHHPVCCAVPSRVGGNDRGEAGTSVSSRKQCTGAGTDAGWRGTECTVECPGHGNCNGHGRCDENATCFCDAGYYSFDCNMSCPRNSNGILLLMAFFFCSEQVRGEHVQKEHPWGEGHTGMPLGWEAAFLNGMAT